MDNWDPPDQVQNVLVTKNGFAGNHPWWGARVFYKDGTGAL